MSTRKRKLQVVAATQRRKMLCSSRRGKFIVFVYRMQFFFNFRYGVRRQNYGELKNAGNDTSIKVFSIIVWKR